MTKVGIFLVGNPDLRAYTMRDAVPCDGEGIELQRALDMTVNAPFWSERGKAIEAYAQLERALCNLFALCSGASRKAAVTIFFKQSNTGSRNATVEALLRDKFGNEFNLFWNSFLKQLRGVDIRRNEIVHWTAACHAALDQNKHMVVGVNLVAPSLEARSNTSDFISTDDLLEFQQKCSFFSSMCNIFVALNSDNPDQDASLLDIYRQPLVYPPPEDHFLRTQNS